MAAKKKKKAKDYHILCCNCGFITPWERWTLLKYEDDELVPVEPGDSDPIEQCPVCLWPHTDDDGNPGIYDGTYDTCVLERGEQSKVFQDHWNDVAFEIFNDSQTA